MSPNISEELFVDTSRGHKLRINFDIVVPRISCDCMYILSKKKYNIEIFLLKSKYKLICVYFIDLVLDAMDSSGEQHLQLDHNIHKRRLDLDGNPIEEPKKEEIATSSTTVSP